MVGISEVADYDRNVHGILSAARRQSGDMGLLS